MAAKKKAQKKRPSPARKAKPKKVAPIPKGMHTVSPMFTFKNAGAALDFYKSAFGAKELYRLCEPSGKIGHAEMMIGNSLIMMGEEYPDMGLYAPERYEGVPIRMNIVVKDVDRAFKQAVSAGAEITRPVQNQFYGWRSGNLKDPFGYHWMISSQVENVSPKQMQKRWNKMFEEGK
jgi:PhnB protein